MRALGPPVRLTKDPASDHSPFISPDGANIVFQSMQSGDGELWVMRADGTNKRQLTTSGAFGHFTPWYDDATVVVRTSDARDVLPDSGYVTMRVFLDGRESEVLGANGGGHISLSPDRQWLADNDHRAIRRGPLRTTEREYSEVFQFTDGSELDYTVWLPSGRWILFDRNRVRSGDIYRIEGLTLAGE